MKSEYPRYGKTTAAIEQALDPASAAVLRQFLLFCASTGGDRSVYKHKRNMLHFADIVEKPLDELTREDALEFWGIVNRAPYSMHSKTAIKKTVKRFLRFQFRDLEMIEELKIPKYRFNEEKLNSAALMPREDAERMLRVAERLRDKALFALILDTGARPDEISHLRWRDIVWERDAVWLFAGKVQKGRLLPVSQRTIRFCELWQEAWPGADQKASDFVFPSGSDTIYDRTKPYSVVAINRLMKRLARKAGIRRDVWTYLFRHTQLTGAWKNDVTGPEHDYFAGHVPGSDQKVVYLHLSEDEMTERIRERLFPEQPKEEPKPADQHRIDQLEHQNHEMREQLQKVVSLLEASGIAMRRAGLVLAESPKQA